MTFFSMLFNKLFLMFPKKNEVICLRKKKKNFTELYWVGPRAHVGIGWISRGSLIGKEKPRRNWVRTEHQTLNCKVKAFIVLKIVKITHTLRYVEDFDLNYLRDMVHLNKNMKT